MNAKFKSLIAFWYSRPAWQWALPLLLLLDLLVYGHVLFTRELLSSKHGDLCIGRWNLVFVLNELRHGNLSLWNPFMLCGTPSLAAFQTLAFYPLTWLMLFVPLDLACNLFFIVHVFWIGVGMFWWLSRRGLHPFSCVVGAALLMFGSGTTTKIYPGHVTVLSAMSWAPFILVVCDALVDAPLKNERRPRWVLLGIFFVAMQIAASFPQHFFYTAAICGVYISMRLAAAREYSLRAKTLSLCAFAFMYLGGMLLMMVQLLTSWQVSKETARSAALPFKFIATCSFPPENFLTLLAPTVLGGDAHLSYWGRWYSWEDTLYIGVFGLVLALIGLSSTPARRARGLFAVCAALMLVMALGEYTPLLKFLYLHVPIFGAFRSSGRALFQASIFGCALSALGFDALLKNEITPRTARNFALGAMLCGVLLAGVGMWSTSANALPLWRAILHAIDASREYFVERNTYSEPVLLELAPQVAQRALILSGLLCASASVLLHWIKNGRGALYLLGVAAIAEVMVYAGLTVPTFSLSEETYPKIQRFLKQHPGDYRFIKRNFNNLSLAWRACDVAGYESFRLRRFDEFYQWTQNKNPDDFPIVVHFAQPNRALVLLRCRYAFGMGKHQVQTFPNALPHVLLVSQYRVLPSRDAIFAAMNSKKFDPRREVILEHDPPWKIPARAQSRTPVGSAKVKIIDTDTLEITANTATPALLLVTDSYSKDWKATPLPDSSQREYSVMPADYIVRAVPLQAGHHHIRMEYSPWGFRVGKWISIFALIIYGACIALCFFDWKKGFSPRRR